MTVQEAEKPRTVVRLKTEKYIDKRGVATFKKKVIPIYRKCVGYNVVLDAAHESDADQIMSSIVNLFTQPDGIYEVVLCDHLYDWESGHLEDYSLKLVPYTELK